MGSDSPRKFEERCVICRQPARLECSDSGTPYCSTLCQDLKKEHDYATKELEDGQLLVEARAEPEETSDELSRDEAATPPPSPEAKTMPAVKISRGPSLEDDDRAKATAAEESRLAKQCSICRKDWDPNAGRTAQLCCFKRLCATLGHSYVVLLQVPTSLAR